MRPAVRVVHVNDAAELMKSLRNLLEGCDDVAVMAANDEGQGGLRIMSGESTEILMIDLDSSDAKEAAGAALWDAGPAKVLALSAEPRSLPQLASGPVLDWDGGDMLELIREHDVVVVHCPANAVPSRDPSIELLVSTLSPREQDVLTLVTAGYSNKQIAEACFLSLHTVRTHVQNILVKLGVHSKLEAAIFAVQHGVVSTDTDGEVVASLESVREAARF